MSKVGWRRDNPKDYVYKVGDYVLRKTNANELMYVVTVSDSSDCPYSLVLLENGEAFFTCASLKDITLMTQDQRYGNFEKFIGQITIAAT